VRSELEAPDHLQSAHQPRRSTGENEREKRVEGRETYTIVIPILDIPLGEEYRRDVGP
jgi:hypothetical protein